MKFVLALAVVLLVGCTATPRPQMQAITADNCTPVEGSYGKQVRGTNKLAYKYICDGQPVWAVQQ